MKKVFTHFHTKVMVLLSAFLFVQMANTLYARTDKEIVNKKSSFILDVAHNIYYNTPQKSKKYVIGVYGRDVEAKAIYAKLSQMTKDLKIDKKLVKIELFKNMRSVTPVDVIFVSGSAKIRLGDLHEKLASKPYSLITENYPFGTSTLNIAIDDDNELMYEIQPLALRNNGAEIRRKILENKQRITNAEDWNNKIQNLNSHWNAETDIEPEDMDSDDEDTNVTTFTESSTENLKSEASRALSIQEEQVYKDKLKKLQRSNTLLKWLFSILGLLTIGLSTYVFKMKRG